MFTQFLQINSAVYGYRTQATSCVPPPQVLSRSLHSQFCEVVGSPTQVNNAGTASAHTICASVQTKSIDNTSGSELAYSSSSAVLDAVPLEWVPATIGPVRSLLDVAPLALVREFTEVVDQSTFLCSFSIFSYTLSDQFCGL